MKGNLEGKLSTRWSSGKKNDLISFTCLEMSKGYKIASDLTLFGNMMSQT